MYSFAEFYAAGGAWMHLVTLAALLGLGLGVAQIAAMRQRLNLLPLVWASVAVGFLAGILGTVVGMIEAFGAIAAGPPDMKDALLAQAVAIVLDTTAWAVMTQIPVVVLAALATTLWLNQGRTAAATPAARQAA